MEFASFPAVESVYEKVTVCPAVIAGEVVSTTVEPTMDIAVGVRDSPLTEIENALSDAVVADKASENPTITCVPAEFTAAAEKAGAVVSSPKLKPETETFAGVSRRVVVPSPSWLEPFHPQHFRPPSFINAQT
jgi:hypothetical protein